MSVSQSHFQNATNFQVNNGQFLNIASNANTTINVNPGPNTDAVTTILWPHVAAGAIFDSAEQFVVGKCHPGTRKRIIEDITCWATDTDTTHLILWLYGPAGAGKSALSHTICELLKQQHQERYGASFFFRSGHPDRENPLKLFTTLSYQLALHFPCIRSQINDAISHDPSLPTKSMETQFHSLITQPLLNCRDLLSHTPILIIDGLDECADAAGLDAQRNIIALIARSIVEDNLPLRVMIASRPEYWIRDAFDTAPLPDITKEISLEDDSNVYNDIKVYLIDGFEKIRLDNQRVMGSVDPPWPPSKVVESLARQASGQYIYASTVLRFVGQSSRFVNPQRQLEIITSPGPHRAAAFSELDRLFVTIISAYPQWETMKRVLEGLFIGANTTIIKVVLGVNADDLVLVLDALSSLVNVKKPRRVDYHVGGLDLFLELESIFGPLLAGQEDIYFYHRSFREFFRDKTRSGLFYVDLDAVRNEILESFFDMFYRNLDQNYEIEPHLFLNFDNVTYHDTMVSTTIGCARRCILRTHPLFSRAAQRLECFDPRWESPDSLVCFMRDLERIDDILDGLRQVRHYAGLKEAEKVTIHAACGELRNTVSLVRQRATHALSLCSTFKVPPILVYAAELNGMDGMSIGCVSSIPDHTDVISTIRQYRRFLYFSFDRFNENFSLRSIKFTAIVGDTSSRIQGEWEEQRIFLVYHYLNHSLKSDLHGWHARLTFSNDVARFLKRHFFLSNFSDFLTKADFQNTRKLSILILMTEVAAWTRLMSTVIYVNDVDVLASILRWLNRQLTNQEVLKLLQDYDESLQKTLITAMRLIFEKGLIPYITKSSKHSSDFMPGLTKEAVTPEVLPLPRGFCCVKEKDNFTYYSNYGSYWHKLHDEVFKNPQSSTIDPSCWYPHLASHLLKAIVTFLHGEIHPKSYMGYQCEKSLPYVSQCLPYAEPTLENLEALRAMVYLYPKYKSKIWRTWNPPDGFWPLAAEFLQKYDRSVLSSEELELFLLWLKSPDHADIETYITQ